MPTLLLSFKRNSESEIIIHGFLAPNPGRAEKMMQDHANHCPQFGPALKAEETIQQEIDVDQIPEFDEDAIGEWLDDEFALDDEDDDEKKDGDEKDGDEEDDENDDDER